ncbi:MAG: hypothetical protein ACRC1T_09905 [Clostridium chrysemydis]|uniref:hypothetical protein n=1 Tax=Clostridium chrysemydis TaxID=2665504 RepID=UPI003F36A469
MKYYVLKINNKMVRKQEITQERDYDGYESVDLWAEFTDDLNLAYKFTHDEFFNNTGDIKYIRMYLEGGYNTVNMKEKIEQYCFEVVDL